MDTGKTCRGCVSVGGRNNFRMAGASRMPAGSRRRLKGSAHPWPVGAGVRDCCRAGLQQCPTMFPWKQLLMHRECYQANSQATNKQTNPPNICFPKDYSLSLKKTLIFLTRAFTVATQKADVSGERVPRQKQTVSSPHTHSLQSRDGSTMHSCSIPKEKKKSRKLHSKKSNPNQKNPKTKKAPTKIQTTNFARGFAAESQHGFPFGSVWVTRRSTSETSRTSAQELPGPCTSQSWSPQREHEMVSPAQTERLHCHYGSTWQLPEGWAGGCVPGSEVEAAWNPFPWQGL